MLLSVCNLTKSFNEKEVLKGISFSVESGSALGLLGRNGAGKTTTIRIIMQLFKPNSGEVLLDGKPIDIREINIGYMPEERGLYPKKKIMEQLIYFAELKGVNRQEAKERAKELLSKLQLEEYTNSKLMTLSKGNQQKVQLVATLMSNPDIVILDEPFSGLDPVNAILLKDMVRELIANGKLVIFSSHQMNYIEEFCDNIVILKEGQVAVSGSIKEIKRSYTNNRVEIVTDSKSEAKKIFEESDIVSNIEETDIGLLLSLKSGVTKNEIMPIIAKSKLSFTSISDYEPTLSDIFVDYTEGGQDK